jgi:hypothetical protein
MVRPVQIGRAMEFVCPDPSARVRAANVLATLEAFKLVPELGRRIVQKHKLEIAQLRPDQFILVQHWLDALREIQDTLGHEKVRSVGRNVIEAGNFPPQFADAESILLNLDEIYYLNHRGNVGHYFVRKLSDASIIVRCETPYPRTFEYGLIDGICRHPKVGGGFIVQYDPGPIAGHITCTLRVRRV